MSGERKAENRDDDVGQSSPNKCTGTARHVACCFIKRCSFFFMSANVCVFGHGGEERSLGAR